MPLIVLTGLFITILLRFGFNARVLSLLPQCYKGSIFSIALNGTHEGFFHSSLGLGQSDPLSPLLFILSKEALSRELSQLLQESFVISYKVPRDCSAVSHILCANDLLIFSNGSKRSLVFSMEFIPSLYNSLDKKLMHKKVYSLCTNLHVVPLFFMAD